MLTIEAYVSSTLRETIFGICRFILKLCEDKCHVTLEISINNGMIVSVKKTETFKPVDFLVS